LKQAALDPREVEALEFGCARQAGLGPNPARQVAIAAGLPEEVTASTTNMACGSGLLTLINGARMIAAGEADLVLVGGMENMTRVPFLLPKARMGYRMGHAPMVDAMYQDGFLCPMAGQLMGETAETLATQYGISRDEQDAFALRSQERAQKAVAASKFLEETVPVEVPGKRGAPLLVTADEHPRAETTIQSLKKLPPVFDPQSGTVTAGNASGITDGAAALLLMSESAASGRGFEPLASIEGYAMAGVDPKVMGIGPVPATRRLLERMRLTISDFDLVELNEAFAAQVIACDRELKFDQERLNVNGGSIALGHPIGCTGARISVTLLHELRRRGGGLGLATLCISGGQGLSVAFRSA
jgi:acetyl-CoA C-acetyltransferase